MELGLPPGRPSLEPIPVEVRTPFGSRRVERLSAEERQEKVGAEEVRVERPEDRPEYGPHLLPYALRSRGPVALVPLPEWRQPRRTRDGEKGGNEEAVENIRADLQRMGFDVGQDQS